MSSFHGRTGGSILRMVNRVPSARNRHTENDSVPGYASFTLIIGAEKRDLTDELGVTFVVQKGMMPSLPARRALEDDEYSPNAVGLVLICSFGN